MDIKQEKQKWRQWVKEKEKEIPMAEKESSDLAICQRILALEAYQKAKTIFCFVGTATEINTISILEQGWKDGKRIAVPRCAQKGVMHAYEISSMDDLEKGKYGILEPKENCVPVTPEEIEFAVIPCVSCDKSGYRLGHGGGYYDRYLEHSTFQTAVVCREKLLLDHTPIDRFDCCMDWVITENESISIMKK